MQQGDGEQGLRETPVSRERIFDGKVIDVEKWTVRLPDGALAPREIVLHRGAAAAVAVDDAGFVTLVRQHRVVHCDDCRRADTGVQLIDAGGKGLVEQCGLIFSGDHARIGAAEQQPRDRAGYPGKANVLHGHPSWIRQAVPSCRNGKRGSTPRPIR